MADTFPASLTCTWTCVGAGGGTCTAAGSGQHQRHGEPAGRRQRHLHGGCNDLAVGDRHAVQHRHGRGARRRHRPEPRATTRPPTPTRSAPQADLSITKTDGDSATPGVHRPTPSREQRGPERRRRARRRRSTFPPAHLAALDLRGAGGGTCTAGGRRQHQRHGEPAGAAAASPTPRSTSTQAATGHVMTNTATVSPATRIRRRATTRRRTSTTIDETPTTSTTTRRPRRPRRRTDHDDHDHLDDHDDHHDHFTDHDHHDDHEPPTPGTTTTTLPGQLETATALTSSPNPSLLGQAVTFTATVTHPGGASWASAPRRREHRRRMARWCTATEAPCSRWCRSRPGKRRSPQRRCRPARTRSPPRSAARRQRRRAAPPSNRSSSLHAALEPLISRSRPADPAPECGASTCRAPTLGQRASSSLACCRGAAAAVPPWSASSPDSIRATSPTRSSP